MVEVLVAMLVLASATVLVSSSLSTSSSQLDTGKLNAEAASLANQQLDWYINYPETTSLPLTYRVAAMDTLPTVAMNVTLTASNAALLLDSNPGPVSPPNGAPLSPAHQDFLYDKELVVYGAQINRDIRKYQVYIYERPPGGARGRLLYSASQISGRLDQRAGGGN